MTGDNWGPRLPQVVQEAWAGTTAEDHLALRDGLWEVLPPWKYLHPMTHAASWTNARGLWVVRLDLRDYTGPNVVTVGCGDQSWVLGDFRIGYVVTVLKVLGALE